MRPAFPAVLFDGTYWERLLARAAEVPASAMADVFGFEIRLGRPEPAADFCVSVATGSDIASHYIGLPRPDAAGAPQSASTGEGGGADARSGAGQHRLARDALAACLQEIAGAGTFANRAVDNGATLLEYDVVETRPGSHPPPGVFWSLADGIESSQAGELARLLAMAAGPPMRSTPHGGAPASAPRETGWAAALRGVMEASSPYGRISQVGTFVGRRQAGIRVIVSRVERTSIARLLGAIGWPGPLSGAMDAAAACALPGVRLGVALDVGPGGVGPRLGLELSMPGGWVGSRWRHWRPLVDILVARGWCRVDKGLGLKRWCGLTRLFGRQMYFLAQGINHVKIGVRGDVVEAKAYLGAGRWSAGDMGIR